MIRELLATIARRCDIHDRPLPPLALAELEEAAGVDPAAVERVWADARERGQIPNHYDSALLDCGRAWCKARRST
jgi:hypothetical protein